MRAPIVVLSIALTLTGCQKGPTLVLEREFPFKIEEPVYLLQPSDFPMSDLIAVWAPRQPPRSTSTPVPIASIAAIGPENTTAPLLAKASRAALRQIVTDMPANLPKRAVLLVSSSGAVIEVALRGARDQLNERIFASRLRALRFAPATHAGKPVAVICEIDLVTGTVWPSKAPEPTITSLMPPAYSEVTPAALVAHL